MVVVAKHADGTFNVEVDDTHKTVLTSVKPSLVRPSDEYALKQRLKDPKYVQMRLATSTVLERRGVSSHARDLMSRMLQYDPRNRITPAEALKHPFILAYCHESLGDESHKVHVEL